MARNRTGTALSWRHFCLSLLICAAMVAAVFGRAQLLDLSSFAGVAVVLVIGLVGSFRALFRKDWLFGPKRP